MCLRCGLGLSVSLYWMQQLSTLQCYHKNSLNSVVCLDTILGKRIGMLVSLYKYEVAFVDCQRFNKERYILTCLLPPVLYILYTPTHTDTHTPTLARNYPTVHPDTHICHTHTDLHIHNTSFRLFLIPTVIGQPFRSIQRYVMCHNAESCSPLWWASVSLHSNTIEPETEEERKLLFCPTVD